MLVNTGHGETTLLCDLSDETMSSAIFMFEQSSLDAIQDYPSLLGSQDTIPGRYHIRSSNPS